MLARFKQWNLLVKFLTHHHTSVQEQAAEHDPSTHCIL